LALDLLFFVASIIASLHSLASYSVFADKKTVLRRVRFEEKIYNEKECYLSFIMVRFDTKAVFSGSEGPLGF
jgi:hypothetical protein